MKHLCFLIAVLALAGCNLKEKYAKNNAAADGWLAQRTAPAKINVAGKWKSDAWGKADFSQSGSKVSGKLGDYKVKGVVSGYRAYLTAEDGGWVYYTLILKRQTSNALEGSYSESVPYLGDIEKDIYLRRDLKP